MATYRFIRAPFNAAACLALAFALSSCGGVRQSSLPTPADATTDPSATVSASAAPSSAAIQAAPSKPAAPEVTSTPVPAPALKTFTFPDGHISFSYPAGWQVRTEQGPYLTEQNKAGSTVAVVSDGSGEELARVMSGMYGDGAAGSVTRTVLEQLPVPGVSSKEPVQFGFFMDEVQPHDGSAPEGRNHSYYVMDVRLAHEFEQGYTSSGTNQIPLANGMMTAYVIFDFDNQPVFETPTAAKAWMGSEQYAQLKALLLSLKYV